MKKEEKLVNNNDDLQIELNFAPNQGILNINKKFEFDIKKNYKKCLSIIFIVFIFCFSIYIERKGYNIASFIKKIKNNLGIKEQIDKKCYELEPLHLFELRLNNTPIKLCENDIDEQSHICYLNTHNDFFIIKMEFLV